MTFVVIKSAFIQNLLLKSMRVSNMAKMTFRITDKKCALCRYWNGAVGSTTIKPMLGGGFQVEMTEKQVCYKKSVQSTANFSCAKFEPRY